jgi:hypothetical protein
MARFLGLEEPFEGRHFGRSKTERSGFLTQLFHAEVVIVRLSMVSLLCRRTAGEDERYDVRSAGSRNDVCHRRQWHRRGWGDGVYRSMASRCIWH